MPIATLLIVAALPPAEQRYVPSLLIILVALSALVGVLQLSGAGFDNLLVNDSPGEVSGFFVKRNHFALLIAMGCVLVPIWAFPEGRKATARGVAALGLLLVFVLVVLASGSRASMLLALLGTGLGVGIAWPGVRREMRRYPRWALSALVGGIVFAMATIVLVSVVAERAVSIQRAFALNPGEDMRQRGLPTVLAMISDYLPFGSGLGGFDPIFRISEPFALLKPIFFNHAHNDFLEILLDAGLPGACC